MSSRTRLALLGLAVAGLAGQCDSTVNNGSVAVATTVRISVAANGAEANGPNFFFAISANGRILAFTSQATNLHPDDTDFFRDIFVKDLDTGVVTLASRADGVAGAKGNGDCERVSISADGRYVAFASQSTNLHPGDGDPLQDIFVRDLVLNTTTLVSRADGVGGAKGDGASYTPAISGNGQVVAFRTDADNFDAADNDNIDDVYVRDVVNNTTRLVSRATGVAGAKGNGNSQAPTISDDGSLVAFATDSFNLDPDDGGTFNFDVYVRDVPNNLTRLISRATGAAGVKGDQGSHFPVISGNGQFVSFQSDAENLLGPGNDSNAVTDIFRRDLTNNVTIRVSLPIGAGEASGPSGISSDPSFFGGFSSISRDGRFVAFSSLAGNLVVGDNNLKGDVFVRDVVAGTTLRASVRTYGAEVNDECIFPSISADGQSVAFFSQATNIVDQDNNGVFDVFLRSPLY